MDLKSVIPPQGAEPVFWSTGFRRRSFALMTRASLCGVASLILSAPLSHDPAYEIPVGIIIGAGVLLLGWAGLIMRKAIARTFSFLWHKIKPQYSATIEIIWEGEGYAIRLFNHTKRVQFIKAAELLTNTGKTINGYLWTPQERNQEDWHIRVPPRESTVLTLHILPVRAYKEYQWIRSRIAFENGKEILSTKLPVPPLS